MNMLGKTRLQLPRFLRESIHWLVTFPLYIYILELRRRAVKFSIQIGSDWSQMGQIWDFLRSVSVHFGSASQNVLKLILKSPRFVPFGTNLTQFGSQI